MGSLLLRKHLHNAYKCTSYLQCSVLQGKCKEGIGTRNNLITRLYKANLIFITLYLTYLMKLAVHNLITNSLQYEEYSRDKIHEINIYIILNIDIFPIP